MANKPISMLQIKRILQLLNEGISKREINRLTKASRNTIDLYAEKFTTSGSTLEELCLLSEGALSERFINPVKPTALDPRSEDLESRMNYFLGELRRTGVTRDLLWREYLKEVPDGYGYSQFCDRISIHLERSELVMHFDHEPAKLVQFDFAGDNFTFGDATTGEILSLPVLVFVLPYSGYTYVEVLPNAGQEQVFRAMGNCMDYFGGVPISAKSDNMKQLVTKSNRYEPAFNELCEQWAFHYGIALVAARVRKPRDKPSVEKGVDLAYKRLYAPLRNDVFYGLADVNNRFRLQLDVHNSLPMQKRTYSRYDRFVQDEKPRLHALPADSFIIKHTAEAKVQKNYHVILGEDWHQYSVPYQYHGKQVTIVYDCTEVEIYLDRKRIALHKRNYQRHGYTTLKEHMPEKHRQYHEMRGWDGPYFLRKADEIGPAAKETIDRILASKVFTEQTYNSCLGIFRLAVTYGNGRMESACKRALSGNHASYRIINNILVNNLDLLSLPESTLFSLPSHENLRGAEAYT